MLAAGLLVLAALDAGAADIGKGGSLYATHCAACHGTTGMPVMPGAVFLRAPGSTNDHDLGLFSIGANAGPSAAGRGTVGLYHLAWEVDTLADLADISERLTRLGALVGATDHSTTKALYAQDPDGLEFEVSWLVPADRITDDVLAGRTNLALIFSRYSGYIVSAPPSAASGGMP